MVPGWERRPVRPRDYAPRYVLMAGPVTRARGYVIAAGQCTKSRVRSANSCDSNNFVRPGGPLLHRIGAGGGGDPILAGGTAAHPDGTRELAIQQNGDPTF